MNLSAASMESAVDLVSQPFTDLASDLRSNALVRSVTVGGGQRHYQTGDRVECYVDAELASGHGVGWWLEFRFEDGSWIVESSVRHNTAGGEDELIGLATRYAVEDAELLAELKGASAALVATLKQLDLTSL